MSTVPMACSRRANQRAARFITVGSVAGSTRHSGRAQRGANAKAQRITDSTDI
jgi:hypothetical protein